MAAAQGIAVAYPDGIGGSWNAGGCCGQAEADDLDDVGFILALVDELVASYSIDPDRVYLTGFSNGGLLAYRLACESDRFAAIAPVGATLVGGVRRACADLRARHPRGCGPRCPARRRHPRRCRHLQACRSPS